MLTPEPPPRKPWTPQTRWDTVPRMVHWLQGLLQFRAWLPDALVEQLTTPQVDTDHARTFLAVAIATFLWSFLARTLWRVFFLLHDWLEGRRLQVEIPNERRWVAWFIGLLALGMPWLGLWQRDRLSLPLCLLAMLPLGLLWAGLRAGDRDRLYWLPAEDCLVLTRALPGLRTAEQRLPLRMLDDPQTPLLTWLGQALGSEAVAEKYLRRLRKKRRIA